MGEFVQNLRTTLEHLGVERLFLFLDDFSELEDAAMGFLMDEVVQPLSAVSEDFLSLKIAVYPNRIYTGKLDLATFDLLRTDFANVYSFNPSGTIEDRGAQFIERVLKKRLNHYCRKPASHFFALASHPPLYELLFQASFANVRSLGDILTHAHSDATTQPIALNRSSEPRPNFGRSETFRDVSDMQRRILDAIYDAGPRVSLVARQIAGVIDESPALVGRAAAKLNQGGFVERERTSAGYSYRLSETARAELAAEDQAPSH